MNLPLTPIVARRPRWIVVSLGSLAILLGSISALAAISYAKFAQINASMSAPPPPEMPLAVTYAKAEPITFRLRSVVVGSVLAPESITVRTELTGVVTQVAMTPGGVVDRGDVLIKLDDRTEQAELKSAEASERLAAAALQRGLKLMRANANSAQELDLAEAELTRAQAAVERLQLMIEKKVIAAPFRARVGLFDLHTGQYLLEGSEITTLEGIRDYVHIDFEMPAHVADAIRVGETMQLRANENSPVLTAELIAVDSRADPISRSVMGRAKLLQTPETLQPGDSVRVTIQYGDPLPALRVPATAVRRGPTGPHLFVAVDHDGVKRAESRPVLMGGGEGVMAYVLDGVKSSDTIVADGSFKVFEGAMLP